MANTKRVQDMTHAEAIGAGLDRLMAEAVVAYGTSGEMARAILDSIITTVRTPCSMHDETDRKIIRDFRTYCGLGNDPLGRLKCH